MTAIRCRALAEVGNTEGQQQRGPPSVGSLRAEGDVLKNVL